MAHLTMTPERYLSVEQVATMLSLHPNTIKAWARSGKLPASKPGRDYRFALSDVERLIEERKIQVQKRAQEPEACI